MLTSMPMIRYSRSAGSARVVFNARGVQPARCLQANVRGRIEHRHRLVVPRRCTGSTRAVLIHPAWASLWRWWRKWGKSGHQWLRRRHTWPPGSRHQGTTERLHRALRLEQKVLTAQEHPPRSTRLRLGSTYVL